MKIEKDWHIGTDIVGTMDKAKYFIISIMAKKKYICLVSFPVILFEAALYQRNACFPPCFYRFRIDFNMASGIKEELNPKIKIVLFERTPKMTE